MKINGYDRIKNRVETSSEMLFESTGRDAFKVIFKDEVPKYEYGSDSKRQVGTYSVDVEGNKKTIKSYLIGNSDLTLESDESEDVWVISYL